MTINTLNTIAYIQNPPKYISRREELKMDYIEDKHSILERNYIKIDSFKKKEVMNQIEQDNNDLKCQDIFNNIIYQYLMKIKKEKKYPSISFDEIYAVFKPIGIFTPSLETFDAIFHAIRDDLLPKNWISDDLLHEFNIKGRFLSETSKYVLTDDPMKNLDEEDSKIILDMLKKTSKPTELNLLKNAKFEGNKVFFDLKIGKKK
ncbi:MAG: hypothetical protein ACTSWL_00355 [Promethearchaeota archaeon]